LACHVRTVNSYTYIVLKDTQVNRNIGAFDGQKSSTKVKINGGTNCYMAPELFNRKAKFSRKSDVFAAGVIFLELLTLQKPNTLYEDLWPKILEVKLPKALLQCFASTLDSDPENRLHFTDLLVMLKSRDGYAIKDMKLGLQDLEIFDEVGADLKLLMPSSRYEFSGDEEAISTRSGAWI
jgi:serine/threonine protein kinase